MVVCFVLEWQIACVRVVKFPVKIPVIHRCAAPCCLSVHREDPGGLTCLILPLPAPCSARMCQPHTSSRCRGGCLCVRSTGLHTARAAIAGWSGYTQQTLSDLWLAGSSKAPGLWPLCAAAAAVGWPRSLLQSNISKKTPDKGGSEFIIKQQASQFPYRPIFNISDRCLFLFLTKLSALLVFVHNCSKIFL